jgi:hypothetical protein
MTSATLKLLVNSWDVAPVARIVMERGSLIGKET